MEKKENCVLFDYLKETQDSPGKNRNKKQNKDCNISRNHKINFHLSKSSKNSININNRRNSGKPTYKANKNMKIVDDFNNILKFNNELLSKACSYTFSQSNIKSNFNKNKNLHSFQNDINKSNLSRRSKLYSLKINENDEEGGMKTIPKIFKPAQIMSYKNKILDNEKNNLKNSLKRTPNLYRLNSATVESNINKNYYLKLYDNSISSKSIFDNYNSEKNNENKNILNNNYDNLYCDNKIKHKTRNLIYDSETNILRNTRHFYGKKIPFIDSKVADYYKIKNNKYNFFNQPLITKEFFPLSNNKNFNSIEILLKKKIISNCNKIKYNKTYYKRQKKNFSNNNEIKMHLFSQYGEFLTENNDECKKNIIYKPIKINIKNKILLEDKIKNLDNEKDEVLKIMSNTFRKTNKSGNVQKCSLISK